ncbi:hypothetical protein [Sphingopyxis macrogoltabida]|nr:hypothetical protein [Sphingopyxis macrogoltabida]
MPEPDAKGRLFGRENFCFVGLELRRGIILHRSKRYEEAIAVFSGLENNPMIEPTYRINGTINRAAILAETRRAEAALVAVDQAKALFAQMAGPRGVEGSHRQFDWIRSCALHSLGRADEAAKMVSGLFDEDIPSRGIFHIPSNESIEFRYRRCIADKAWFRDFLTKQMDSPWPHVGIESFFRTEKAESPLADLVAELRAAPFMQQELEQFRQLPEGWRDLADRDRRTVIARRILAGTGQ